MNDDSSVIKKFETSLTDDARVVICDRHMFIALATGCNKLDRSSLASSFSLV